MQDGDGEYSFQSTNYCFTCTMIKIRYNVATQKAREKSGSSFQADLMLYWLGQYMMLHWLAKKIDSHSSYFPKPVFGATVPPARD